LDEVIQYLKLWQSRPFAIVVIPHFGLRVSKFSSVLQS